MCVFNTFIKEKSFDTFTLNRCRPWVDFIRGRAATLHEPGRQ